MSHTPCILALLIVAGILFYQERAHAGERRDWRTERASLIQRLTGVVTPGVQEIIALQRPFDDETEALVEKRRRKEFGIDDQELDPVGL